MANVIEGIAADPAGMSASGNVTISYGNAISDTADNAREAFLNLLATTMPISPASFGGVSDTSASASNYVYNSAPFGNCGQLNALGGAFFSATLGYQFELWYSSFGHVICTIDFPGVPGATPGTWIVQPGFQVVESYGSQGVNHFMNPAQPDSDPFYTLSQITAALTNGDPTGIWAGVNQNVRDYYGASGATITPSGNIQSNDQWNEASLTLANNESVTFGVAPYNETLLYGMGQMTLLPSQSYTSNDSPTANEVTVVRTENANSPILEHIEVGLPITGVMLTPQPGFSMTTATPYFTQSWYAADVWPVAPTGTIALPGFTPDVAQAKWISGWQVIAGSTFDTGAGVIITGSNSTPAQLNWTGSFTNQTGQAESIWIPVVYRTDTPTALVGGNPVATITADGQTFNLSPSDGNLHYQELLVTLNAGQSLNLALQVAAGDDIDIVALGTETNISDIISPQDPASAVNVDFSGDTPQDTALLSNFNVPSANINSIQSGLDLDYSVQITSGQSVPLQSNEIINNQATPIYGRNPLTLNQATVTRTLSSSSPAIENIASPFLITGVTFTAKPGVSLPSSYLSSVTDAAPIWAAVPIGDRALPGFTPDVRQSNWASQWTTVVTAGGKLANPATTTSVSPYDVDIDNASNNYTYLQWSGTNGVNGLFTNTTSSTVNLWLPLVYRSDTPSPVGNVGQPVATVFVQQAIMQNGALTYVPQDAFNIYPQDRDLHYKDIATEVTPGESVRVYLEAYPGEDIDVVSLGAETNIAGILSPENAADAVDVDLSGLAGAGLGNYASNINLAYDLMVSPYLSNETLTAGPGDATLSSPDSGGATMIGGTGNDSFYVHDSADVVVDTAGTGTIYLDPGDYSASGYAYELPTNVNTLVMDTTGVTGEGNGADDVFYVNDPSDMVSQSPGTNSTIESSISYTLPANINALVLTGSANLTGTGNGASDSLYSNSGTDVLIGNGGDDAFYVNNSHDVVSQIPGTNSVVYSTVNYQLPTNVSTLIQTGSGNLIGTGNGTNTANTIYANSGNDSILDNGSPTTMYGGAGNDTFYVTNSVDTIIQNNAGGNDVIRSTVSYTLPNNVNTIVFSGNASLSAIGNGAVNWFYSNNGVDTLSGQGGNDVFIINNSQDVVIQLPGSNSIVYSSVSYALPANVNELVLTGTGNLTGEGNSAANAIYSNSGIDTLIGLGGNDIFYVNNSSDILVETSGAHATVYTGVNYQLPANVDTLVLNGSANVTVEGNGEHDVIHGNSGNDVIFDGGGSTVIYGGGGNNSFYISNTGDTVVESHTGVSDIAHSSVSFTLPTNVNELELTGSGNLTGTGDKAANWFYSNSGIDTFYGQGGNDVFIINNSKDVVNQLSDTNSIIYSNVSYALPTTINNLYLLGSANVSATGNNNNDVIYGNSGNNTLTAGSGNDTVFAGNGNDTIFAGSGNDTLWAGAGNDIFAFDSPVGVASVMDFLPGTDEIELSASAFKLSSLQDGTSFIAGANPHAVTAAPTILYNTSTGSVSLSPNGTGSNVLDTFAKLAGAPSLHAASFTFGMV